MISKAMVVGAYHAKLKELARLGVQLTAVVPQEWGGRRLERVDPQGYELVVLRSAFSKTHHFHFFKGVSEVIAAEKWDLVHIDEEPFNLVTYHALRACVREGKKAIFFTWQNIRKRYPPPFSYFERYAYRIAEAAIAGTEEVRDVLQTRGFSKPVKVIPQFGVDPDFFRKSDASGLRREVGLADKFVIGFVGRIVEEKGIADLIHALTSLPERCVLMLVGNGPEVEPMKRLSEELSVAGRVRWVSHISSLEVPGYMNAMDVLVLPSRTTSHWKEQFGRVLIEAMSCETPVVGSSSAEIPRVIGDAGLVFPEGDVSALVHGLRTLYENADTRAMLGAEGRSRVQQSFAHGRIAAETAQFYRGVLNGPCPDGVSRV